jgi:hypothetical protein
VKATPIFSLNNIYNAQVYVFVEAAVLLVVVSSGETVILLCFSERLTTEIVTVHRL